MFVYPTFSTGYGDNLDRIARASLLMRNEKYPIRGVLWVNCSGSASWNRTNIVPLEGVCPIR